MISQVRILSDTTRICGFAECSALCQVLFLGHSAKNALSSAALGKVLLSVNNTFTESRTLGTEILSAKIPLSSVKHSAKVALGKGSSAAVNLCRGPSVGTR
jgi:hypothetical protein